MTNPETRKAPRQDREASQGIGGWQATGSGWAFSDEDRKDSLSTAHLKGYTHV